MTQIAKKIEELLKQVKDDLSGNENSTSTLNSERTSKEPGQLYEHAPIGILAINQKKRSLNSTGRQKKYLATQLLRSLANIW